MRHDLARLALAVMAALCMVLAAEAQSQPKNSPFGIPLPPTAESGAAQRQGIAGKVWVWVLTQQQRFNREMAAAVRSMKTGRQLDSTALLAFVSFAYGVLHAAGPGHGKAVISSYVLANERTVRRGVMLSFLAAFIQALSAIAIVGVLAIALNATSLEVKAAEAWIETVSWGLVAVIGAWLLYGQIRSLMVGRTPASHHQPKSSAFEGRHHDHGAHDHASGDPHHGGSHVHHHGATCECEHAHVPDPKELEGELSGRKALAIAFSVGVRPCTGAILVLIFALSQGILLAGIFATFAMALGTAITVSALASLALGSRELAIRMAGANTGWTMAIGRGAGLIGSALVLLLGASFFVASLSGARPF